jgi:hypothetical protein
MRGEHGFIAKQQRRGAETVRSKKRMHAMRASQVAEAVAFCATRTKSGPFA